MLKPIQKKRAYEEIVEQISNYIEKKGLKREDRLPSERELCETFEVSRPTLREALLFLETMKLIERRQGSGTFVIAPLGEALAQRLVPLS